MVVCEIVIAKKYCFMPEAFEGLGEYLEHASLFLTKIVLSTKKVS